MQGAHLHYQWLRQSNKSPVYLGAPILGGRDAWSVTYSKIVFFPLTYPKRVNMLTTWRVPPVRSRVGMELRAGGGGRRGHLREG